VPKLFHDYFISVKNIHKRMTRQVSNLHIRKFRIHIRYSAIKIHGAKIWNALPNEVREARSLNIFKSRLRNHLLNTEPW